MNVVDAETTQLLAHIRVWRHAASEPARACCKKKLEPKWLQAFVIAVILVVVVAVVGVVAVVIHSAHATLVPAASHATPFPVTYS